MAIQPERHALVHHEDVVVDETASTTTVRRAFGLVHAVTLAFGLLFAVTGGVGIARTGWAEISRDVVVGPWRMTGIMALTLLGVGIVGLLSAADSTSARGFAFGGGTLLIAASLIMLIAEVDALSDDPAIWISLLISGVVLLGAGLVASRSGVEERSVTVNHRA